MLKHFREAPFCVNHMKWSRPEEFQKYDNVEIQKHNTPSLLLQVATIKPFFFFFFWRDESSFVFIQIKNNK